MTFQCHYFLADIADGLVGVGLITQSEDMPGVLTLDKGHSDISKFLNRILGMKVHLQNALFNYFSESAVLWCWLGSVLVVFRAFFVPFQLSTAVVGVLGLAVHHTGLS